MATHSSILAWRIPLQRSLVGWSPWGCKEWAGLSDYYALTLYSSLHQVAKVLEFQL